MTSARRLRTQVGTVLLAPAILALARKGPALASTSPSLTVTDPISALPEPWRSTARDVLRMCCGSVVTAGGCTSGFVAAVAGGLRAAGYPEAAAILDRCANRRRAAEKVSGPSPGDDWENGRKLGTLDCKYKFHRVVSGTSRYFQEGYAVGLAGGGCRSWT